MEKNIYNEATRGKCAIIIVEKKNFYRDPETFHFANTCVKCSGFSRKLIKADYNLKGVKARGGKNVTQMSESHRGVLCKCKLIARSSLKPYDVHAIQGFSRYIFRSCKRESEQKIITPYFSQR